MGTPAESAQLTDTHAALKITGYLSSIHDVYSRDNFDYLDVGADLSMPDIPPSFEGVSGGGLWQILIKKTTTGQFRWDHSDINLEGVAFINPLLATAEESSAVTEGAASTERCPVRHQ